MLRRISGLMLVLLLAACAASCRKRVPGVCRDHVECEAGFDCVEGKCARRAAFPGAAGEGSARPAAAARDEQPAAPSDNPAAAVAPGADADAGDTTRRPPPIVPARKKAPATPEPAPAAPPSPGPGPGDDKLPLYKQRLKNG